jgi:peptidoglycan/LPS O-acetylase OafA/YrhL
MPMEVADVQDAVGAAGTGGVETRARRGAGKILYLESIRGIAAFVVVLTHLAFAFYPALKMEYAGLEHAPLWMRVLGQTPLCVVIRGGFSVRLFFVLSGIVLSLSFFQSRNVAVVTAAALRRYFRLMIPVLGSCMLAWALLKTGAYHNLAAATAVNGGAGAQGVADHSVAEPTGGVNDPRWLARWYQLDMGFGEAFYQGSYGIFFNLDMTRTLNPVVWSMPVELQGSFAIFAFLVLCGNVRRRPWIYAILAVWFIATKSYFFFDFLVGVAACDAWTTLQRRGISTAIAPWMSAGLLLAGLVIGGLRPEWIAAMTGLHTDPWINFVTTFGALAIIVAAITGNWLQGLLHNAFFVFLGRISFALYLVHMPLICSLACWTYLRLHVGAGWSHDSASLMASGICIVAALGTAAVFYYLFDAPAIWLGRRVETLLTGKRA